MTRVPPPRRLQASHASSHAPTRSPTRWVVAFNGARDGYQVPLALAEHDRLESLVTDWYSPLDTRWAAAAERLLPRSIRRRLRARHRTGLPSSRVHSMPMAALRTRVAGLPSALDDRLGSAAGTLARTRGAGLLAYSYYAAAAFDAHGSGASPRVIFQVHPHPASLRRIYGAEAERCPERAAGLMQEEEMRWDDARFRRRAGEPLAADWCLAASSFTRSTLIENGVPDDRVRVIPYGVDIDFFHPASPADDDDASRPFRVLFVGQMMPRKGLHHLLEAWERLALPDAELILAGRGMRDDALLTRHAGQYRLSASVSPGELRSLYQSSDVFCMPSLAEGFGHVYLESLACGTPIIGTPSSGVPDIIAEGEEGFLVPPGDVDALADRLAWCHANRTRLREMRSAARRRAEQHHWGRFRSDLTAALADIESAGVDGLALSVS